jgi:geranylgeranyl diphosphate synthase type 3
MDDVEDNSELRRGIPVSHLVYGVPQTINTANYVYFLAVQELLALDSNKGGELLRTVTGGSRVFRVSQTEDERS